MRMAGLPDNPFSIERVDAYRRVLKEHQIPFEEDHVLYGEFWEAPAKRALRSYLDAGGEVPEAFICANDTMAVTVCDELVERGVRVPQDCIVTGFDGFLSNGSAGFSDHQKSQYNSDTGSC